jgi:hypothetical protein
VIGKARTALLRIDADEHGKERKTYHGGTETRRKPDMNVEFIKDLGWILSATIRVGLGKFTLRLR